MWKWTFKWLQFHKKLKFILNLPELVDVVVELCGKEPSNNTNLFSILSIFVLSNILVNPSQVLIENTAA